MGRPPLPLVLTADAHGHAVGFWASAAVMAVAAVVTLVLVERGGAAAGVPVGAEAVGG